MNTPVDEADAVPRTASQDARDLREALKQLGGQGDVDEQIISLDPIREGSLSIGAVLEHLKDLKQSLADAAEKGIQVPRDGCPVDEEELEQLVSDARERKLVVADCRRLMSDLNGAVVALRNSLETAWRAHCGRLLPEIEGLAGLTEAMSGARLTGSAKLHAKVKRAIDLQGMKFSSKHADAYATLAAEIKPAIEGLVGSDPVVAEFLRTAAASGFSLNDFLDNDSIIEWLRENDLLGAFIVTTSSSQST
jgi:hypothetical protein